MLDAGPEPLYVEKMRVPPPPPLLGLYRGFRDTGYLSFYFKGYRILSILLLAI